MNDHYRTLAGGCSSEVKVQRSRFLAIAFPVSTEEAFQSTLHQLSREHHDANHHCWAFQLDLAGSPLARSSDAGEPSGTAGRPILQVIEKAGLFDCGVVVVRWFGGVKLGTGGLARAYREAASAAIAAASIEDRYRYDSIHIETGHENAGAIYRMADPPHLLIREAGFTDVARFELAVRKTRLERAAQELAGRQIAFRIERS